MKKKLLYVLCLSFLCFQCDIGIFSETQDREFIFENYTDLEYTNSTISVGEIRDDKIIIRYTEEVPVIPPKGNASFSNTSIGKSEIWDEYLIDFVCKPGDVGCFLIEFSDSRKLFIAVGYDGDFPGSILDAANRYIIEIKDSSIYTLLGDTNINGIPVNDFEIIRN